jgi:hypothetical protein
MAVVEHEVTVDAPCQKHITGARAHAFDKDREIETFETAVSKSSLRQLGTSPAEP